MKCSRLLSLVALLFATLAWGGDTNLRTGAYQRTRTFQNLGNQPNTFWGNYLTLDESTVPAATTEDARSDSNTWWQIKMVGKHRDYTTHVIVNRGNNIANGRYLSIDTAGKLYLSEKEVDTSYWLIRYNGQVQGYDAWIIQNLPSNHTAHNMAFLSLHEETGLPILTSKAQSSSYWHMHSAPDLPTESKY